MTSSATDLSPQTNHDDVDDVEVGSSPTGTTWRLLCLCARPQPNVAAYTEIARLARSSPDWAALYEQSRRHGVTALVYSALSKAVGGLLPDDIDKQFREQSHATVAHNLQLASELRVVCELFARHNIDILAYKGPALSLLIYGDLARREFSDLDLVVAEKDVEKAFALLIKHGYTSTENFQETEHGFGSPNGTILVDVHWRLSQRLIAPDLPAAWLWKDVQHVNVLGVGAKTFSPETLLIALCIHGAKHLWAALKWVSDIAALLETYPNLDWELCFARAKEIDSERTLLVGLWLAHTLLGATLPNGVGHRFAADPEIEKLAAVAQQATKTSTDAIGYVAMMSFYVGLRRRRRRQAEVMLIALRKGLSPLESDKALLPLPGQLFFLYYLLRPTRSVLQQMWRWLEPPPNRP